MTKLEFFGALLFFSGCAPKATTPANEPFDKPTIQRVVRSEFPAMERCYREGLKRNPELRGRVSMRLVIGPAGNVVDATHERRRFEPNVPLSEDERERLAEAKQEPLLEDTEVIACIAAVYRTLVFPRPESGPHTIIYPITFKPE